MLAWHHGVCTVRIAFALNVMSLIGMYMIRLTHWHSQFWISEGVESLANMNNLFGEGPLHSPRICARILFTAYIGHLSRNMKIHTLCNGNVVQSVGCHRRHIIHEFSYIDSASGGRRSDRSFDRKKWFPLLPIRQTLSNTKYACWSSLQTDRPNMVDTVNVIVNVPFIILFILINDDG